VAALPLSGNRLLGGNLRFQTLAEPFAIYADGPITPLFEEFAAGAWAAAPPPGPAALWASDVQARFRRLARRGYAPSTAIRRLWIVAPEADQVGRSVAEIAAARGSTRPPR
jgi:N-acyl-D-aspartate/D-glutamate deacylase